MKSAGFYIFYVLIWIWTLLPLRILYIFSDMLFPFMYYFPGYRRKIVAENLRNSFPEKTNKELREIEKKFYHHFCDIFIETFKLMHLNNKQLFKRVTLTNPDLLNSLYDEGRDVVAVLGHYCNWEWLILLPLYTKHQTVSIYKPLQDKHFDRFMINFRSRNGMILSPMSNIVREIIKHKKNNTKALYAFITDQTPPRGDILYRTNFLNQDTPVYLGAEKIALKYNMSVVFFRLQKIKRGRYSLTMELLFRDCKGLEDNVITEAHVKRLEEIIREKPEYWVWTHRRWKYKREQPDG